MVITGAYLTGPLLAFVMVGALALVLRWTFGGSNSRGRLPGTEDFGLLRPVATVEEVFDARAVQQVLAGAGIRSTLAVAGDGYVRVLVFEADVERARWVVGGTL